MQEGEEGHPKAAVRIRKEQIEPLHSKNVQRIILNNSRWIQSPKQSIGNSIRYNNTVMS